MTETQAQTYKEIQKFGDEESFLANVILCHHGRPHRKLHGLRRLLANGHSVKISQFSIDTLLINGKIFPWRKLEDPLFTVQVHV
jgi:hypothetical protein